MQAAAPRCMWPSEWEGTLTGWNGLTIGRGCPNIVSCVLTLLYFVSFPEFLPPAAGWCFLHGSLRHMTSRSLGPQLSQLCRNEGYLNERFVPRQSCCCLPDTQQEWDFRTCNPRGCCWLVKKKGQRVDFWKKKAVETERCRNAILRYEKACDLRSLVDEATGAMLVSMRVVWEPTGSWPTCLQL